MSQENKRTLVERVLIRRPRLAHGVMRWVLRLPPGSGLRKALLARFARMAFLSWNRGDFAMVPVIDDPDVETNVMMGDRFAVGLDAVYHGPDGHCRAMEEWNDSWREWDAEIDEVIEEGNDQVVVVARVYGEGAASGLRMSEWGAIRYTFRDGRILRVNGALDPSRDRAVEAAGLRE
jgi:ketosteroid isomerase-like protein